MQEKETLPNREEVSLLNVLKNAIRLFPADKAPACDMDIPDNIALIYGDERKLSPAINCLIRNAADAMPVQTPVIVQARDVSMDTENKFSLKGGPYVKIAIESKGSIASPEKPGPVDLGLFLSCTVVKELQGNILVESDTETGTVFSVFLPAAGKDTHPEKAETVAKKERMRVLLMDDDPLIVDITSEMLEEMGYDVASFREGSEVLETYKNAGKTGEGFDVAVLDIVNRLGMDGKQTLEKLREMDPEVKAIGITGYMHDVDIGQLKQFGFQEVLSKPYKIEDLMDALKEVLRIEE